ncbi:MAG: DUF4115 domain-containing protein [Stellaceae bacterium]
MLLAALIFALCGYGLWYYVSTGEHDRPERVSAVPADLAGSPAAQATSAPSPSSSATAAKAAEPTAAAPPPSGASVAAAPAAALPPAVATAAPATAAAAAGTSPATAATPPSAGGAAVASAPAAVPATPASTQGRVYGAEGGVSRIVIAVTKDSWLQIHDGDRVLLDKVLHPGDSYRVGDRSGLVMRTGNAAGLDIEVDGRRTPPIKGTVRRQIALDPARLIAGTAAAD